jgi:isocitrate dehydrogenase (NAD+)
MTHTIVLLPGDGIGPEVTDATVRIVESTGLKVAWKTHLAGQHAVDAGLGTLPSETLDAIRTHRIALKGPITTPVGKGFTSVNVGLRKALDLYVSLRPVNSLAGVVTRHADVNLVVFRENTEGLYAGREHEVVPGVVEALKIITEGASRRIAKYAFEYARWRGRRRVTVVHKADVMKRSDGLFLSACDAIARDYPFIVCDEMSIDRCAMELVLDPTRFDVLLMENLYGDILSDLCAGLVGGLGVVPGANIGDTSAVFEAVHGSAPDIAGQNKANPTALLLSAVMMLRHIGELVAARRIEVGVERVLSAGQVRTGDLGGRSSTTEYTQAIIDALPDAKVRALDPRVDFPHRDAGDALGDRLRVAVVRLADLGAVPARQQRAPREERDGLAGELRVRDIGRVRALGVLRRLDLAHADAGASRNVRAKTRDEIGVLDVGKGVRARDRRHSAEHDAERQRHREQQACLG